MFQKQQQCIIPWTTTSRQKKKIRTYLLHLPQNLILTRYVKQESITIPCNLQKKYILFYFFPTTSAIDRQMLERFLTCCVHRRRRRDDTGSKHNSESEAARIYPNNTEIVHCCNRSRLIGLTNHGWFSPLLWESSVSVLPNAWENRLHSCF